MKIKNKLVTLAILLGAALGRANAQEISPNFLKNPLIMQVKVTGSRGSGWCVAGEITNWTRPALHFYKFDAVVEPGEMLWPLNKPVVKPTVLLECISTLDIYEMVDGEETIKSTRCLTSRVEEGGRMVTKTRPFDKSQVTLHEGGEYIVSLSLNEGGLYGKPTDWGITDDAPPMEATPENLALVKKALAERPKD